MTQGSEPVPLVSQGSMRTARLNRPFAGAAIDRACNLAQYYVHDL